MTNSALNYKDAAYRLGFVTNSQANYIRELEKTVTMLIPFVDIANIWARDSFQHEQVLLTVLDCLQNPAFLAYWAFKVWSNQQLSIEDIQYLGANFQDLLSPYVRQENQQRYVQQIPQQLQGSGVPYGMIQQIPMNQNPAFANNFRPQNISISTPSPTSYNTVNNANPLQQVLMAMRSQGVSGLVNARKAGVI